MLTETFEFALPRLLDLLSLPCNSPVQYPINCTGCIPSFWTLGHNTTVIWYWAGVGTASGKWNFTQHGAECFLKSVHCGFVCQKLIFAWIITALFKLVGGFHLSFSVIFIIFKIRIFFIPVYNVFCIFLQILILTWCAVFLVSSLFFFPRLCLVIDYLVWSCSLFFF